MRLASSFSGAAGVESVQVQCLRWVVFALASSAFWLSFFHSVAPAAIAAELQASFGIGAAMLGTLAATYYLVYTVMQVPRGILNDTLGPRRVLTAGCAVSGGGALLFGAADAMSDALAGLTLIGLASAWFMPEIGCRNIWISDQAREAV